MPDLHSRLGYLSTLFVRCEQDEVCTNVDNHTLMRELCSIVDNEARHSRHSCFLWLWTDLPTCLRELQDKMRTGRKCGRWDRCTLHTLILVFSRAVSLMYKIKISIIIRKNWFSKSINQLLALIEWEKSIQIIDFLGRKLDFLIKSI